MSIKTDPEGEGWRAAKEQPTEPTEGKKVDGRTKEAKAAKARDQLARESEAQARAESEQTRREHVTQIAAAVGNSNNLQLNRRNEIADALDAKRGADFEGGLEPEDTEALAKKAEDDAQAERERLEAEANERAAKDEQEAGVVQAEPKKFKLKVNGKEIELTEQELIERAQKVESADEYLQTAAKAVERMQALPPSKDGAAGGEEDPIEDTLTSALQGDSEAIKKVAQRLRAPPVKDVLSAVDDRMSFRSAVSWFQGEYKDVVSDPMLYQLVVGKDAELARTEPSLPYQERLKRSGDYVRTWKQGLVKTPEDKPNPKLVAKASVAPVPQASGRQVVKDEEDEEEPVETIIERMAKSRGLSGAIKQ